MQSICVYCGSSSGRRPAFKLAAQELAREMGQRGINLVYGGGSVGIMQEVADAMLKAGGQVVGVIPEALQAREVAHHNLTELVVVRDMHERKAEMSTRADAFIALPGGLGTLEELFEMLTWLQLGFHDKPCGILNVDGYFDALLTFLDHTVAEEFVKPEHRDMLITASTASELIDELAAFQPPTIDKWWVQDA